MTTKTDIVLFLCYDITVCFIPCWISGLSTAVLYCVRVVT